MKTSLLALARIGIAPVMLLITQTIFIGLLVVGLIYGLRRRICWAPSRPAHTLDASLASQYRSP